MSTTSTTSTSASPAHDEVRGVVPKLIDLSERVVDINALRALAPPSPRPRSQAITPPAPHAAAPLEPQAQQRRPVDARIAAIASDQSRPIASRAALLRKVEEAAQRFGAAPPRPERWVGYRVWAERVELWVGQPARIHDRAVWTRALTPAPAGFTGGPWQATRLQP